VKPGVPKILVLENPNYWERLANGSHC
jgi:hypothetical protein